jgi:hypothetical protein
VAFSALVFVKRHSDVCSYHIEILVTTMGRTCQDKFLLV